MPPLKATFEVRTGHNTPSPWQHAGTGPALLLIFDFSSCASIFTGNIQLSHTSNPVKITKKSTRVNADEPFCACVIMPCYPGNMSTQM